MTGLGGGGLGLVSFHNMAFVGGMGENGHPLGFKRLSARSNQVEHLSAKQRQNAAAMTAFLPSLPTLYPKRRQLQWHLLQEARATICLLSSSPLMAVMAGSSSQRCSLRKASKGKQSVPALWECKGREKRLNATLKAEHTMSKGCSHCCFCPEWSSREQQQIYLAGTTTQPFT